MLGVVPQQPGDRRSAPVRIARVGLGYSHLRGKTSGGPIHTTRIVPGTPYVRRRYGAYMSIEILKK